MNKKQAKCFAESRGRVCKTLPLSAQDILGSTGTYVSIYLLQNREIGKGTTRKKRDCSRAKKKHWPEMNMGEETGDLVIFSSVRAKDLSGCHLLECLQKEAGNGPGAETESSFGGEESNKQTVFTTVVVQRSEG